MTWLDRLLGRPTLDGLVRDVTRWLGEHGCTDIEAFPERMEMRAKLRGSTQTLSLGNLFHEYARAPRKARAGMLDKFLASVTEDHTTPDDYQAVRGRLMPVVRSVGGMGIARLSASGGSAPAGSHPAQRPLVADLVVGLVVDRPNSMSYVQERMRVDWGVSWEQAYDDAVDNLRGLPEHGGWVEAAPGVWSGEWGDAYESSRLLLPDLIYRLGINDPVAMVPFRHSLLVTSAANPAGLEKLVQIAHDALDSHTRWLSFELLRLQGTTWTAFAAPETAAEQQSLMRIRSLAEDYEGQRQVLQGQFSEQNIDIFVAEYTLIRKAGGPLTSYSVWSENADTLLPQSQSVVMFYKDGEQQWHARLPWAAVQQAFGHLMERTEHEPPRFRVRRFPDRAALHALAAQAQLD